MNKDELLKLREQIINNTRQLALDNEDADPAARLEVLMGLIRSGDTSSEVMHRAYEVAAKLPEDSSKLDAFLDLVYEIDTQLGSENQEDDTMRSDAL